MAKKTEKQSTPRDSSAVAVMIVAVVSVSVIFAFGLLFRPDAQSLSGDDGQAASYDRRQISVEGNLVCLQHRDPGSQTTAECAYGLRTEDGTYYAVQDSDSEYKNISSIPFDKKVKLTGTFDDETNERYLSDGTLTITDAQAL